MKRKSLTLGALVLLAGSAAAYEGTQEGLEKAVRDAQFAIERAPFDGKAVTADLRRQEADAKLAKAQAELDAFKSAGPAAYEQARLEKAVKDDHAMIDSAWLAGKLAYRDAQVKAGTAKLAKDEAALEAFKTAGPTGFEQARLQDAIAYDKWEIATAGYESKMVQRDARVAAAREKLAQHEAALGSLK